MFDIFPKNRYKPKKTSMKPPASNVTQVVMLVASCKNLPNCSGNLSHKIKKLTILREAGLPLYFSDVHPSLASPTWTTPEHASEQNVKWKKDPVPFCGIQIKGWSTYVKISMIPTPIRCMGLVYLPTFTIQIKKHPWMGKYTVVPWIQWDAMKVSSLEICYSPEN